MQLYNAERGQMVCGSCRRLLSYPLGSKHVECSCCKTVNYVLEGSVCFCHKFLLNAHAPLNFQLQLIYGKPNCMFFRASSRASEVWKLSSASDVPLWCCLSSVLLLLVSHLHWSMHSLLLLFSIVDDPWMNDSCWSSVLFMIESF